MPLYYKNNGNWTEFNPNPYPVGTLVMNKDVDTSPAALVGGTWEKWDNTVESNYTLNHYQTSITNFQLDSTGYCSGKFKVSSSFTIHTKTGVAYPRLGKGFFLPANFDEDGYAIISDNITEISEVSWAYLCIDNQGNLSLKVQSSFGSVYMPRNTTIDFGYNTSLTNPFGDFYNYKRTA